MSETMTAPPTWESLIDQASRVTLHFKDAVESGSEAMPAAVLIPRDGSPAHWYALQITPENKTRMRLLIRMQAHQMGAAACIFGMDCWTRLGEPGQTRADLPRDLSTDPRRREAVTNVLMTPDRTHCWIHGYRREGEAIVWEEPHEYPEGFVCEWNPWKGYQ